MLAFFGRLNWKWEVRFDPSSPLQLNWHIFFWAELETKSLLAPKLSMAFQCRKVKLTTVFGWTKVPLRQKPTDEFWNLTHLACFNSIGTFFPSWIGSKESVFPQSFRGLSVLQGETLATVFGWTNVHVLQGETLATVFGWTNVHFRQNNPIKVETSDTEGLRKVLAKTELWFPMQSPPSPPFPSPKKKEKLSISFKQTRRLKFQMLWICFV